MHKLIQLIVILLLMTQFASAQERQIKILNPDGTPATDAKAIAIMAIGISSPVVNENLELKTEAPNATAEQSPVSGLAPFAADMTTPSTPLPPRTDQRSSVKAASNNNGTISFDENPYAIVARSDQGFVFIPKEAFTDKATLRPWAKLKIDIRTIPQEIRDSATVEVVWTNCFGGRFPPGTADGLVIEPSTKKDRIEDWRIDPFVRWTHHTDITLAGRDVASFEIQVPPGEVSVRLIDTSRKIATDADPLNRSGYMAMLFSLWKTRSGSTTDVAFSASGSVKGRLVNSSQDLPDWNQQHFGQQSVVVALPTDLSTLAALSQGYLVIADRFPKFARFLNVLPHDKSEVPDPPSQDEIDQYVKYLATDEGFQMRKFPKESEAPVEEDGSFYFPALPVGEYTFLLKLPISQGEANDSRKPPIESVWLVKSDDAGHGNAAHAEVKDQEIADLGEVHVHPRERSRDGKTESIKITHVVTEDGSLRVATADDFARSATAGLPIAVPNPRMIQPSEIIGSTPDTSPTATGDTVVFEQDVVQDGRIVKQMAPQRVIPAGNAPLYQPGTSSNAVSQSQPDAAADIIEQWLKTAGKDADREELNALLQKHLESEFDANQKSRQAEIERLQQLLGKSKEWLNKRQERRDEIIKKRIEELLRQRELPTPKESSLRR